MKNKLFIDDTDAYVQYTLFVEQYNYKQVIQYGKFKTIPTTDWAEYDGIEADLSNPLLNTRSIAISFCFTDWSKAKDLFLDLSDGAYHTFYFTDLGKTYTWRLDKTSSYSINKQLGKISLTFVEDTPTIPTAEPLEQATIKTQGFSIDGYDLSLFNCYVLDNSIQSIRQALDTKENLSINTKQIQGAIYDSGVVLYKNKDIKLTLLINTATLSEFWQSYEALFAKIVASGEHTLTVANESCVEGENGEYQCYYNGISISKFDILGNGHVWCNFSLTLSLLTVRTDLSLLATEDETLVVMEDDNETYIET